MVKMTIQLGQILVIENSKVGGWRGDQKTKNSLVVWSK
jgi:hypothetical protein